MSKITIIEGNSNDKDNIRNYLVKGERGYSAYELYVQNGGTLSEEEWLDEFLNATNFYSKSETDDLLDDKSNITDIVDGLESTATNKPLSANQGNVLKGLVDANTTAIGAKANASDVYTKTEVDTSLESYALKSNVKVSYSETITYTSTVEINGIQIPYPDGFNKSNSMITSWKQHLTKISDGSGVIRQNFGLYDSLGGAFFSIQYRDNYVLLFPALDTTFWDNYTIQIEALFTKLEVDISDYTLGDVNMDGVLDQSDLDLVYGYIGGNNQLTAKQFKLADMNGDGNVTTQDYVILNNIINNS